MRYNSLPMMTMHFLSIVLFLNPQSSSALTPVVAAPQQVAADDGPVDAVPTSSKCPRDRRLSRTLRYAIIPLNGEIGDSTVTEALDVFIKGSPASRNVNALVIQFNVIGGNQSDTTALVDQILKIRKVMPVIGVFGSCHGPGAVLPVLCDYVVVLNPTADGIVMDWAPGSDLSNTNIADQIRTNLSALTNRASDRTYLKSILKALLDPTVDLYLWRGGDGCPEAGESAPAGVDAVQLSSGKDLLTGMTGAQLVTAGIAIGVTGGIDQIGLALGVKTWQVQSGVGEKILQEIQETKKKESVKLNSSLRDGFAAIKAARNLVGALIEAEGIARETDPRRAQYQGSYSRSWRENGWGYSSGGTYSWRKNCDTSIDAWNVVLQLYRQASEATSYAQKTANGLAASPRMKSTPEYQSDVAALQSEVDALMAQSGMLTIKGQNAERSLKWLRDNYNNPVY